MPLSKPGASAILAVYNSEATIEAALTTLLTQSIPLEIIVVDDGSTDNTHTTIIRIIEAFPGCQVTVLKQEHGGPALARNLGASKATTDILLFVDADMTFDRDYVKALIAPILAGKTIGTYTTEERVANWDNPLARYWNYQEGWEDGKRFPKQAALPSVALAQEGTDFRAIKKSEFVRVGGFDNIGYTDTWSLFGKLGVRPLATKAICYHHNPGSYQAVYRQAKWLAKRPYKLGPIGNLYALLRTSLPLSLVAGIYNAAVRRAPGYFIFKLVYDFGRFVGILEMILTGKLSK
jgi:glycosyltransferase involved in cell wall biosynthesis